MKQRAGELMYESDSLYVSTEMILSRRVRESPLDGLLLEACLLHFRVVWDVFYLETTKYRFHCLRPLFHDGQAPGALSANAHFTNGLTSFRLLSYCQFDVKSSKTGQRDTIPGIFPLLDPNVPIVSHAASSGSTHFESCLDSGSNHLYGLGEVVGTMQAS